MLASTSVFGGGIVRKALPIYVVCVLVILSLRHRFARSSPKVADVVRREVTFQSSPITDNAFPKKIWQTWKVDPLGFEQRDSDRARTWTAKNPGHRYEVLTDNNDLLWVETNFGPQGLNRPDIVHVYRSLTARIVKADLLRYLIIYVEGGTYADIDVEALRPIDRFIPERYHEKDMDMVIGVEIDQPEFDQHKFLGKKAHSFCQWTFMCKARSSAMLRIINSSIKQLNDLAKKQNVPISDVVMEFDDILVSTGPTGFTRAVLAEMSARTGKDITWDYFHSLAESRLVGGILVLTVEAFCAGQGHSDSGNHNSRSALVKHHYHASGWPSKHPRYKHPVYEEVEKCNWEPECVKLWDANTAAFEVLSLEEQTRMIEDKRQVEAREAAQKLKDAGVQAPNGGPIRLWDANILVPLAPANGDQVMMNPDSPPFGLPPGGFK
ncbi:glycosyl transferase [Phlyctema vagabunda]|uniref:Glycosyl transferase n=1 Tax=Phlyctema vagabunda TaxID=108571 RepID=A0ABR4PEL2_9HELO